MLTALAALAALAVALAAPVAPSPEPAIPAQRQEAKPAADAAPERPKAPPVPEQGAAGTGPARAAGPVAFAPEGSPVLKLDRTSRCFERERGGRWRAQCDATTKTCLVAPDVELSREGEPRAGLDRATPCASPGWREQDLAPQGYSIVPAIAETPPGWRRDERQRIMQVNFDLARRIWLGAGFAVGSAPWTGTGEATAGLRWDMPMTLAGAPALGRLRALETWVIFDGGHADFTLVGFDASRAYPSPLLRITTFVGKPRRFDPPLYLGGWLEAVHLETIRAKSGAWFDRTEIGAAALTLDLWRSRDLASFFRLRGGVGYEVADQLTGNAWVPHAAADLDLTLDRDGFHHLRATAMEEWIVFGSGEYQPRDATRQRLPLHRTRLTGKAEYEVILLAVNDQPISAVLDARVQKRNDVPDLATGPIFQATASLRFNLWAPPRRDAPSQERL